MPKQLDPKIIMSKGVFVPLTRTDNYDLSAELKAKDVMFIHLKVYSKWTASLYRELLCELVSLFKAAKDHGIEKLYVLIPANDEKLFKFETKFGFVAEKRMYRDVMGSDHILMSQGTT